MRQLFLLSVVSMALHFLAWEVLEERVNMMGRRVQRRRLRDAQNPYDLPDGVLRRAFRISPKMSLFITDSLRPFLGRQRSTGLYPEIQVSYCNELSHIP